MIDSNHLIWIDLEMTGRDPFTDHIIEVATIVTDKELNIISEGPVLAIHQAEEILLAMDEWNTRQHTQSGLIDRVRQSTLDYRQAEVQLLEHLRQWVPKRISPMCGNSICHDRRFLARCMPELHAYFHYRNIDVSTLKELARRWAPEMAREVQKANRHMALDDVKESIEELRFYKQRFLKCE